MWRLSDKLLPHLGLTFDLMVKRNMQRGLGHWEGLTGEAVNESDWREGDVGGSSTGHIEQDMPDDEISEGILDLTEQFSQDLWFVDGVPDSMLHTFTL